jgi:hypothetical protein
MTKRIYLMERDMAKAVKIHTIDGVFTAVLGEPGRIYTPYVSIDFPVRKRKMANGDVERFTRPLLKGIDDYPIRRICNHMLRVGRQHGITKGAKALLQEAKR